MRWSESRMHESTAIRSILDEVKTATIVFLDATSAFNSLNSHVALANISQSCPTIYLILVNIPIVSRHLCWW